MELLRFERLKAQITEATASQVLDLERLIQTIVSEQIAELRLARRTNLTLDLRQCPHCSTRGATLHGKDKRGRQRFICCNGKCHRTYNILTGTPMARARKPEKWGQYLSHMTEYRSIRKIVQAGIGVNHITVWRWRHRFLKAAANNSAIILSGVIEVDETFFLRSFKGSRGWKKGNPPENRAARPRAWGASKPGLSSEQVPVLTALDNSGGIYETILTSLRDIEAELEGRIAPGSILCSDGAHVYERIADAAGVEHRRIFIPTQTPRSVKMNPVPTPARRVGRLSLGRVNSHHGKLKVLVNDRCRGVATKYLANYLGWHRAMIKKDFVGTMLLDWALALA
jgi:transposase-like protein